MTENEAQKWLERFEWDDSEETSEALATICEALQEYPKFKEIGTIEEFKALKEKSVGKKPEPIDYEKYIDVVYNAKFLRGAYWCPNCKHTVRSGDYCDDCGQKLDWSE